MSPYSGWVLTSRDEVLAELAARGIHPAFDRVDCGHITYTYPADRMPPGDVTTARLVAVAVDGRVQALLAEPLGAPARPGGQIYHVTYSLAPFAAARESNDLLSRPGVALRSFEPVTVAVEAFLREP